MCGSLKYLARFSAITSGEMDDIRARIVSVAEILGANGIVDNIDTVERLIGIVLVSKSGTARSVDLAKDTSFLFGLSEEFNVVDEFFGNVSVDCMKLLPTLLAASFIVAIFDTYLSLFDGKL